MFPMQCNDAKRAPPPYTHSVCRCQVGLFVITSILCVKRACPLCTTAVFRSTRTGFSVILIRTKSQSYASTQCTYGVCRCQEGFSSLHPYCVSSGLAHSTSLLWVGVVPDSSHVWLAVRRRQAGFVAVHSSVAHVTRLLRRNALR